MSRPLYECSVCGTKQPAADLVASDETPDQIRSVTCRHKYGGCCRRTTMHRVEGRSWEPVYWELFCMGCQYETVAWGEEGFGTTGRWACPDCGNGMQVLSVELADDVEG